MQQTINSEFGQHIGEFFGNMFQEKKQGFSSQQLESVWGKYGISEHRIFFNGERANLKGIVKNGKLVYTGTEDYHVFPNEEAQKLGDECGTLLGAVPFDKFTGNWYTKTDEHVFLTGRNQCQMHALYTFNQNFDIGGGDTIQLGYGIHNSINGSLGFSIGAFTFRHACRNMVFMGASDKGMKFDDREILCRAYQKHTNGFCINPELFKSIILTVVEQSKGIIETYRQWHEQELQLETVRKLFKNLPEKYMPEYIKPNMVNEVQLLKATTVWETYNDLTAAIWHNDKTDYSTKRLQMNIVHSAIMR